MKKLSVTIQSSNTDLILCPTGISTPYTSINSFEIKGGQIVKVLPESNLGLTACLIQPDASQMIVQYMVDDNNENVQDYPESAFKPHQNRFTIAASELASSSREIALQAGGGRSGIEAIIAEVEEHFTYAHPEHRFNDNTEEVPYLSCGTTPGSCVDINTYLIASLRSAGYEAAYIYGYFFPEERNGITDDGHCWVVTRHNGEVLEWDIAHHIKANLGPTKPSLNPRPGKRVAMSHSMGHLYNGIENNALIKILGEPLGVSSNKKTYSLKLTAKLEEC